MTNKEVMQQALEALIDAANVLSAPMFADAVAALRTALEQPEQGPICYASINKQGDVCSTLTQRDSWRTVPLYTAAPPQQQAKMRMPKVGDRVICLEDESLGEVVSLTAGGSPDIAFDDGTRGTYLLREFAELFGYAEQRQQQAEQPPQRQWVGLTDEEIEAVVEQVANEKLVGTVQEFRIRFSRAIEAKLKEKNT